MIADDLTGACDAGVAFAAREMPTVVWLDNLSATADSAALVVLTTDSRSDTPEFAGEKVREACQRLARAGARLVFKKIDSTLRGNLSAEIEAALQGSGCAAAVVAPAFPAIGRTMVNGKLCVRGIASTDLATLLEQQGARHVARCSNASQMADAVARQARLVTVDAASDEDLMEIVAGAMSPSNRTLLVGSGGLAARTAAFLSGRAPAIPSPPPPRIGGSLGFFTGSAHSATEAQVRLLLEGGHAATVELDPGAGVVVERLLRAGRHVIIPVRWQGAAEMQCLRDVLAVMIENRIAGLVLCGGDTARLVCRTLGAGGIRLQHEILPGIPWGMMIGSPADGLRVCTKAGGFGDEEALLKVVRFLAGSKVSG